MITEFFFLGWQNHTYLNVCSMVTDFFLYKFVTQNTCFVIGLLCSIKERILLTLVLNLTGQWIWSSDSHPVHTLI